MAFSFVHQSWQSAELRDRQLLPSRESRRQNSATTSLSIHGGIKHWLREMVQQRQARQRNTAEQTTHSSQSQNTELASNFRLIDVLTSLSQRVLENPKILAKDSPERFQLEAMMREQIQAFVAEQLGLPYHSYANEVDLGKWVSDNTLETFHPKYADTETRGDLLNMARKAATVNTGAEGDRYRREQTQLEVLYHEKLTAELTNWQNESTWTPTTAEICFPKMSARNMDSPIKKKSFMSAKNTPWLCPKTRKYTQKAKRTRTCTNWSTSLAKTAFSC
ncbi:hypothetical protein LRY60_04965 [Candidatus Woesebacteria bacterium]|nr:hypothetical protein [Candidatus Woesebacteria bacterium]